MVLKQFDDGLVLRRGRKSDADRLSAFFEETLSDEDEPRGPANPVGIWTRDLFTRPHPTTGPRNFTIVEDTRENRIVSALGLISQTWAYEGVEFGVGQTELVATDPGYRNRGLVREQFDVMHRWSRRRGHLAQVVEGIPYFYRQFGYEMCLPLHGFRAGAADLLPKPGDRVRRTTRPSGCSLRPAEGRDIPFLRRLRDRAHARWLVSAVWDEAMWRYQLTGRTPGSAVALEWRVIEDPCGAPCGCLAFYPRFHEGGFNVIELELAEGASWLSLMPSILEHVREAGEHCARETGQPFTTFRFALGTEHPAYEAASQSVPVSRPPYRWYVRVPNVAAFINRIVPALEKRLAASNAAGYSGDLKLSFYRDGVRIVFDKGRIVRVRRWPRPGDANAGAKFPDLSFLQLLFGCRSFAELEEWYADCYTRGNDARMLLRSLFPKRPSNVHGIG